MGLVYTEIELINGDDLTMARRNLMDPDDVKRHECHHAGWILVLICFASTKKSKNNCNSQC